MVKVLCTICAREGSKGVPSKNIRLIAGKPLIVHTIEQALACSFITKTIVSTDGEEIAQIAREAGAFIPFLRPSELATDDASKGAVLQHAVRFLQEQGEKYDFVIDLDPTSPLRTVSDIEAAFHQFLESDANNLYSVTPARRNPYFNMIEVDGRGRPRLCKTLPKEVSNRQMAPPVYDLNASIYIYRTQFLLENPETLHSENTVVYIMPEERSIDIDTPLDFKLVELLLQERQNLAKAEWR